jgi:hypothetical protein
MASTRIRGSPGVHQFENPPPLFLGEIQSLFLQFVICQTLALDSNTFISCSKIAIKTLLLADAGRIDGHDHKNTSAVKYGLESGGTGDDRVIQLASSPKFVAPQQWSEIGSHLRLERV